MRTKTLLIAAAALAAGVISSQAQPVYSQNVVGYVNVPLAEGYTMISAALSPNTTNNAEAVLPALASGDYILLWDAANGGYDVFLFNGPSDWYDGISFSPVSQPSIPPGSAVYYQNNTGAKTNTFVGSVTLTNAVTLYEGYTAVASTLPIGTSLEDTNLNLPLLSGDYVLTWNSTSGGYNVNFFNGPGDWYDGISFSPIAVPTLTVGAGFLYQNNNGQRNWTQNLVIK